MYTKSGESEEANFVFIGEGFSLIMGFRKKIVFSGDGFSLISGSPENPPLI